MIGQVQLQLQLSRLLRRVGQTKLGGQCLAPGRKGLNLGTFKGPLQLRINPGRSFGNPGQRWNLDPVIAAAADFQPVASVGFQPCSQLAVGPLQQILLRLGDRLTIRSQHQPQSALLDDLQLHRLRLRWNLVPVGIAPKMADLADHDAIGRPRRGLLMAVVGFGIGRRSQYIKPLDTDPVFGVRGLARLQADPICSGRQFARPDQLGVGLVDFAQRSRFITDPQVAVDAAVDRRRHRDSHALGTGQLEAPQIAVSALGQRSHGIDAKLESSCVRRTVVGLHLHTRRWRAQRLQPDRIVTVPLAHGRDDVLARQQELVIETDALGTAAAQLGDRRAVTALQIQLVEVVALQLNPP